MVQWSLWDPRFCHNYLLPGNINASRAGGLISIAERRMQPRGDISCMNGWLEVSGSGSMGQGLEAAYYLICAMPIRNTVDFKYPYWEWYLIVKCWKSYAIWTPILVITSRIRCHSWAFHRMLQILFNPKISLIVYRYFVDVTCYVVYGKPEHDFAASVTLKHSLYTIARTQSGKH